MLMARSLSCDRDFLRSFLTRLLMNKPMKGIGNLGSKLIFIDNKEFSSLGDIIQVPTKV